MPITNDPTTGIPRDNNPLQVDEGTWLVLHAADAAELKAWRGFTIKVKGIHIGIPIARNSNRGLIGTLGIVQHGPQKRNDRDLGFPQRVQ